MFIFLSRKLTKGIKNVRNKYSDKFFSKRSFYVKILQLSTWNPFIWWVYCVFLFGFLRMPLFFTSLTRNGERKTSKLVVVPFEALSFRKMSLDTRGNALHLIFAAGSNSHSTFSTVLLSRNFKRRTLKINLFDIEIVKKSRAKNRYVFTYFCHWQFYFSFEV